MLRKLSKCRIIFKIGLILPKCKMYSSMTAIFIIVDENEKWNIPEQNSSFPLNWTLMGAVVSEKAELTEADARTTTVASLCKHGMTPNYFENDKCIPYVFYYSPRDINCRPFCYMQPLGSFRGYRDKCTKWPKCPEHCKINGTSCMCHYLFNIVP